VKGNMKIVVDIGHPAHVHVFRHFINEMKKRGHQILITSADKDIAQQLLDEYGFDYIKVGRTGKSFLRKVISIPILDFNMYKAVRKFNPDLFVGLGSIRSTHVSRLMGKKSFILTDTEATLRIHIPYYPFAHYIISPRCFGRL